MDEMKNIELFRKITVRRGAVVQIITNNYCNLHCEWCSFMCHQPFSKDSSIISHREKWDMPESEARLFCERFKGHYEESVHKLLGGETTAMPPEKLYAIIDVFNEYGRSLKLLSNGFNIMGLSKDYLKKLDYIELNDHGINHDHVAECFKYLKTFYKGKLIRRQQSEHYDLGKAQETCFPGAPCNSIMNPPVLCRGVIYPCCIHPGVELWSNNWGMSNSLKQAGWSLENPDVADVLKRWKQTIPDYVIESCNSRCWVSRRIKNRPPMHPITLKKNDVVRKGA